jgi:hypothetical protein
MCSVKMYIEQLGFSNTWCCLYYRSLSLGETWKNFKKTKGKLWRTINIIVDVIHNDKRDCVPAHKILKSVLKNEALAEFLIVCGVLYAGSKQLSNLDLYLKRNWRWWSRELLPWYQDNDTVLFSFVFCSKNRETNF